MVIFPIEIVDFPMKNAWWFSIAFWCFLYVYQRVIHNQTSSGCWYTYPSEKYEFVNGKDDIPYMKWEKYNIFQTTNQIINHNLWFLCKSAVVLLVSCCNSRYFKRVHHVVAPPNIHTFLQSHRGAVMDQEANQSISIIILQGLIWFWSKESCMPTQFHSRIVARIEIPMGLDRLRFQGPRWSISKSGWALSNSRRTWIKSNALQLVEEFGSRFPIFSYGCVWKWLVPLHPMVLLIIIPFLNGYFIGNINPTFSDKPIYVPMLLRLFLAFRAPKPSQNRQKTNLWWLLEFTLFSPRHQDRIKSQQKMTGPSRDAGRLVRGKEAPQQPVTTNVNPGFC